MNSLPPSKRSICSMTPRKSGATAGHRHQPQRNAHRRRRWGRNPNDVSRLLREFEKETRASASFNQDGQTS